MDVACSASEPSIVSDDILVAVNGKSPFGWETGIGSTVAVCWDDEVDLACESMCIGSSARLKDWGLDDSGLNVAGTHCSEEAVAETVGRNAF